MKVQTFLSKYRWWIIGGLIALIVLPKLFRFLTSLNDGAGGASASGAAGSATTFKCNPSQADRGRTFGLGATRSNETCYLQTWLNTYYSAGLKVDGAFGQKTRAALDKFKPGQGITMTLNSLNI